eukprot:276898_1
MRSHSLQIVCKHPPKHISRYHFSSNRFDNFWKSFENYKSETISGFRQNIETFNKNSSHGGGTGGFFGNMSKGLGNVGNMGKGFGGKNPLQWFLEHCQESHARDIATRMGLSVNNIEFKTTIDANNQTKIKAYIDAPNASEEQLKQLSSKVSTECPMSKVNNMLGNDDVQWVKK